MPPYFSRREVLLFLLRDTSRAEAASEYACWRAAWAEFSGGIFDRHGHDGSFLEFQKVGEFYGYSPARNGEGRYVLQNHNVASVT